MYAETREYLLAIVSAATFLVGFNALIIFQMIERRLVSLRQYHVASWRQRLSIVFVGTGTLFLLFSIQWAVSDIPQWVEGGLTAAAAAAAQSQLTLASQSFQAGFILSFLGLFLLGITLWRAARDKPA